ncbi:MAG: hypothetical protein ACYC1E_13170 [Propionibacteriaceae bacterium]
MTESQQASTEDGTAPALPSIVLESVTPEQLGMGAVHPQATPLMIECVRIIGAFALAPERCRLVLTGDFISSVRRRVADDYYRDNFNLARSTGQVGGKTMGLPAGDIDVLMPADLFDSDLFGDALLDAQGLTLRTVLHEAQHVAIRQAGETWDRDREAYPFGRLNLLSAADAIIEEFRAERAVRLLLNAESFAWDLVEVLQHWLDALRRISCVEYQEHLDVSRLWEGIGKATLDAWKLLAYAAATERADQGQDPELAHAAEHELWRRMVQPHWERFSTILHSVPDGTERISSTNLDRRANDLADELAEWMHTLGFSVVDDDEGFGFYITDWSLLIVA